MKKRIILIITLGLCTLLIRAAAPGTVNVADVQKKIKEKQKEWTDKEPERTKIEQKIKKAQLKQFIVYITEHTWLGLQHDDQFKKSTSLYDRNYLENYLDDNFNKQLIERMKSVHLNTEPRKHRIRTYHIKIIKEIRIAIKLMAKFDINAPKSSATMADICGDQTIFTPEDENEMDAESDKKANQLMVQFTSIDALLKQISMNIGDVKHQMIMEKLKLSIWQDQGYDTLENATANYKSKFVQWRSTIETDIENLLTKLQ